MKRSYFLLVPAIILASCGGGAPKGDIAALKKQRAALDLQIKQLEGNKPESASTKVTPVSITEVQPTTFTAYIEVQSAIEGDENVVAAPQAPGTVKAVNVRTGQHVGKGQVLAILDASTVDQQIEALMPQLNLQKALVEKQENLWRQNIGTEVQLMSTRTQYESIQKQIAALRSQKDMYRVVSPISGTVDAVNLKVGDYAAPGGNMSGMGIRIVNADKLKAEANLGENYLGKVKEGDPVQLIFPSEGDTMRTKLSYVSRAVDAASRAFEVQVQLKASNKLHPNMSCIMRIANYQKANAMVVPVSVIQKTSGGTMLYIADGDKAKAVQVTAGRNSNGFTEILSGLNPGDKVITTGFEAMEEGQKISIQ